MHHGLRDDLTEGLYDELRFLARTRLAAERPGHTLQPTALANEACLRLLSREATWEDRAHFLASAAVVMRTILVDAARRRRTDRHGGAHVRVPFDEATPSPDGGDGRGVDVLALDQALDRLEALDPRGAEVVRLRFFAGAEVEEIARMLDVSARTVKRDWRAARLWLYEAIQGGR